jgi:glycosidase
MTLSSQWWKDSIVYQIYPRSFLDTNGDGIGDLRGIINKLDYIRSMSVDAIWVCPVCCSPDADNGYDISDYYNIDQKFGTICDMVELIAEGKKRGIGIIVDLVLNHTSDQHPWFVGASAKFNSKFRDYYIWEDGVIDNGKRTPPNDMQSIFGGSAWTYNEMIDKYYLHLFDKRQPDLNWQNPNVRQSLYKMINYWINLGVAGFRLDVIDLIGKVPLEGITKNGPRMHEYIQELHENTFAKSNMLVVGETWGVTQEEALKFVQLDRKELNMLFQFEPFQLDEKPGQSKWDLAPLEFVAFKKSYKIWQNALHGKGWNALFGNNHDLPRMVSRWGSEKYRIESAKLLATVFYLQQGTPFIYQGEEIGMTNLNYTRIDNYVDVEALNLYKSQISSGVSEQEIMRSLMAKGRDNARSPMQWDNTKNAGFTSGKPWYGVNKNYTEINVNESNADNNSVLNYYRKLFAYRKGNEVIRNGDFVLHHENDEQLFAYTRRYGNAKITVLANFSDSHCDVKIKDLNICNCIVKLGNYPSSYAACGDKIQLRPWECIVLE